MYALIPFQTDPKMYAKHVKTCGTTNN